LKYFLVEVFTLFSSDDVEINIEGARKLGITAILWKGADEARKELSALSAGFWENL
jgi:hypothetical protein